MIRKPPYGAEDAFAGLRLALATIANAIETRVVLFGDGVLNGIECQNPEKIGMPSIIEALEDLLGLDVKIYCVEEHMMDRGIKKADLKEDLIVIEEKELPEIILTCDAVTTF